MVPAATRAAPPSPTHVCHDLMCAYCDRKGGAPALFAKQPYSFATVAIETFSSFLWFQTTVAKETFSSFLWFPNTVAKEPFSSFLWFPTKEIFSSFPWFQTTVAKETFSSFLWFPATVAKETFSSFLWFQTTVAKETFSSLLEFSSAQADSISCATKKAHESDSLFVTSGERTVGAAFPDKGKRCSAMLRPQ